MMKRHAFHLKLNPCCNVIFVFKRKKEMHGELADLYGYCAPYYADVKFWVGNSNAVERL